MVLWNHYEHSTRVSTISFSFTTRYYMYSHSQYFKHARRKHLLNHHTLPNKRERKKEIHKTNSIYMLIVSQKKLTPQKRREKRGLTPKSTRTDCSSCLPAAIGPTSSHTHPAPLPKGEPVCSRPVFRNAQVNGVCPYPLAGI